MLKALLGAKFILIAIIIFLSVTNSSAQSYREMQGNWSGWLNTIWDQTSHVSSISLRIEKENMDSISLSIEVFDPSMYENGIINGKYKVIGNYDKAKNFTLTHPIKYKSKGVIKTGWLNIVKLYYGQTPFLSFQFYDESSDFISLDGMLFYEKYVRKLPIKDGQIQWPNFSDKVQEYLNIKR